MHKKYMKAICYCPICGWIDYCGIDIDGNLKRDIPNCHYHTQHQLTLITDRSFESIYNQVAEENNAIYTKSTGEVFYVAKEEQIKDFVRREYVEAENNDLLNPGAYRMCLSMEEGAEIARERHARNKARQEERERRENSKKTASVVGCATAGAVIAGPAGAIVGAVSALDKNLRDKK